MWPRGWGLSPGSPSLTLPPHLADPRDLTSETGPFTSQVGHSLSRGGTWCTPGRVSCPCVGKGTPGQGAVPSNHAPPRLLLQFPMEDGTYGVTLPPELFREDAADGAGGEEGSLGWLQGGWDPQVPHPLSLPQWPLWKPAPAPWHPPTPSWWLGGACFWASPSSLALQ